MSLREEADRLRVEIAEAEEKIKNLKGQVSRHEARLRRIAADSFNEESEPIDGMVVDAEEIFLGAPWHDADDRPCNISPIGLCVFSDQVISIPGQRAEQGNLSQRTTACLFCGNVYLKSIR